MKASNLARVSDVCIRHCSTPLVATGSPNVFTSKLGAPVGVVGVARVGDFTTPHLLPCGNSCCLHSAPIAVGSSSVFVNKLPAAYMGSKIAGCTVVSEGSPTVYVGI